MNEDATRSIVLETAVILVQEGRAPPLSTGLVAEAADLEPHRVEALFPDTQSLLEAILERAFKTFVSRIEAKMGEDDTPGAWTRAYVRASVLADPGEEDFTRIAAALLASAPFRQDLVESIRADQQLLRAAFRNDGIDPVVAHAVQMAVDGIWMNRMFSLVEFELEERRAIADHLIALATPARRS